MATKITLRLTNRAPKKPIKKLPETVSISPDTTVENVKVQIARAAGIKDHNRIGLFDPTTKKTLKDRRALVCEIEPVINAGEIMVKDLGPQLGWRTVFLVEYLGPILIHLAVIACRPYMSMMPLYSNVASVPLSQTQLLVFGMVLAHFVKRELETLFVHRFSAATMPAFNIFKNSIFYWALSGLLVAYGVYSPVSEAATASNQIVDIVGLAIFLYGEISNAIVHLYLSSLRPKGTTTRGIPTGYGFGLVTCPNYMFEVLSWVGVIIASRSWTVVVFIVFGALQMKAWAWQKEKAYRTEFGDKYKNKRYTMIPGLF